MIRHIACIILVFSSVTGAVFAKKWEIYKCELMDNKYCDGDSFWVKTQKKSTYVFRLYGVDCPETDKRIKDRLTEQAKDFKIKDKDVIKWGEKAKAFTKKFLRKPFTVYTQKIDAKGAGKKKRYFAIIVNADGKRLDEALVEAGLARVHGKPAKWDEPFWGKAKVDLPRKISEKRFMRKLYAMESKAKRDKVGVWKK